MSFNARIKSKRDTASNWETNNPVLLNGELIIVDTNAGDVRFKIGDGVKTYTQLPFQDESLYNVLSTKADSADLESIQASIVQSDLSQTDNTAIDYVKGVIRQESLPEGYPYKYTETILNGTFEFADSGSVHTYQITDENFTITPGRSYTVIWDGVTYQCVAIYAGIPALGNLAIAGVTPNTGEPFLFVNDTNKLIYTTDTAATHTIIVHEEIVHTIASEFLPLTFDSTPKADSTNPVTSGGVKNALDEKMSLISIKAKMPNPDLGYELTYGNGKFVAVADNSMDGAYSEDGITWTKSTMPTRENWSSVTYGNGKFVAVASSSSRAAYSEDGITWTSTPISSSGKYYTIAYGNGKFVTVANDSDKAAYSTDGITWTETTIPSSSGWTRMAYGNGKFVVLSSSQIAYSEDGITWSVSALPSDQNWDLITYGNGKFVGITMDSNQAGYSEDGITWTATTLPSSKWWVSVVYGNGKFVVVEDRLATAAYSEDGITWAATTLPSAQKWNSVTYGNGKFVATAWEANESVAYSEDGITWKTELKMISQNGEDVTADTLIALNHTPDLSQTDSTQIDYVKGVIRKESLPEGYPYKDTETILDGTFEFAAGSDGYQHTISDENFSYTDGKSYYVIWDGTTYQCVATIFNGLLILGNLAIAGVLNDTGEPFLFIDYNNGTKLIATADTATTHMVTVFTGTIHQIAEEFIPDIARGMIVKTFNGVMSVRLNWSSVTYGNGKFVAVAFLSSKAAYREDDSTWKSAIMPSTSYWSSVTYGNGKFVAVSDDSSTASAYSEDGITWTAATLPSSEYWQSVTYGNGKFVAVAQNSTAAAYSEDGITWAASTMPSSADWRSVTYGNGKFVAVAHNSTSAAYSEDGIAWTETTMPSSADWHSVTYGNGKFVAVAYNSNKAAYSEDGITWTATTMATNQVWTSVTYGNGKFVAVAFGSGKAAYSTDGITWIDTAMPSSEYWQSVTYGNGKFVAVVNDSVTVAYSRDGINWKTELKLISQNGEDVTADTLIALNHTPDLSQTDSTQIDYVKGVIRKESLPEGYPYRETVGTILDGTFEFAYSDGIYQYQITDENFAIIAGESYTVNWDGKTYRCVAAIFLDSAIILGNLAISDSGTDTGEPFLFFHQGATNGITTKDTATTHTVTVCSETIHQIADDFIPDIGRGMILKNFNGTMPAPMNWSSVTYGNGKFVTVALLSSKAAYREDDSTWKSATLPSSAWWFSIAYGNGKFVIVSFNNSTRAAYSEDGITWAAATMPSRADWRSVTYGNGKFVAVAQDSTTAAYSTDGITWTAATLPSSQRWSSVTYGNGKFVAVAQDSTTAAYSADGIAWTETTMPSSETWFSVTYGNGKFVAVANNSTTAAYSNDGITWAAATMPSRANWYSITYGNGKFVTIADGSTTAAYSTDGITWIQTTLPSSERWQSVTYGNGKFVAVVNASVTVAYSRDGINWKTELKLISQNGEDVTDDTLIALEHTHAASKISAGTFAGQVVANASGQTPGTMLLRNSKLVSAEETPTVNGEICWVYS